QRLIELIFLPQKGDDCRVAFLAGHCKGRIARQQLLQAKDQDRDKEQSWNDQCQPAQEEAGHLHLTPIRRSRLSLLVLFSLLAAFCSVAANGATAIAVRTALLAGGPVAFVNLTCARPGAGSAHPGTG